MLTKRMCDSFRTQSRIALKGLCQGHESVELQQIFRLGHTSDLLYFGLQKALVALHKFRCARECLLTFRGVLPFSRVSRLL